MKIIFLTLFLTLFLLASPLKNINTFSSEFTQKIVDDKNNTLFYKGNVHAKKPQFVLWNYIAPIKKSVYIKNKQVIVIEPELEQVIMKKIEQNFDFFKVMENAVKIDSSTYKATYNESEFFIYVKGETLDKINYRDSFENSVTISFSKHTINKEISDVLFTPKIPQEFDVITE